jgi:hypothetical protein
VIASSRERRQHEARPGRRAVVAGDLADLRGPDSGMVVLPLRLFWSPPGRQWNLDYPDVAREMYAIVLNEAIRPEELADNLNAGLLAAFWPRLFLPRGVRRAWEERHPSLRAAAAA